MNMEDAAEIRRKKNAKQSLDYYYRNRDKVLQRMKTERRKNKKDHAIRRFEVGGLTYGTLSRKPEDRAERIRRLTDICVAMGTIKP